MAKRQPEAEEADILVSRAATEAEAFALLYDIYYERIFGYCIARLRLRQIAEDLTGATFLAAVQKISKFKGKTRTEFANWLYAIATEKVSAYLRKKAAVDRLVAAETNLSQEAIDWISLHKAILKLKAHQQAIVAFRFFENLPVNRIADIMGLAADEVRLEIARIIETLNIFNTESQFEQAIKKLAIDSKPDLVHKERLRAKVVAVFDLARRQKSLVVFYAVVLVIILLITSLSLRYTLEKTEKAFEQPVVRRSKLSAEANLPLEQNRLERIKQLAASNNIAELLKILESDDMAARLLAAKYLAELTDSNVADILRVVQPASKRQGNIKPAALQQEQLQEQRSIRVVVLDRKTEEPISGAKLQIAFDDARAEAAVDSNGQCLLTLPGSEGVFELKAIAEGYAVMKIQLQPGNLPAQVSFQMSPISTVGGRVLDDNLKPVAGAQVRITAGFDSAITDNGKFQEPVADIDGVFETDSNGFWRCSTFPQDACQAAIQVVHPDYVSLRIYRPVIVEELRNFSCITFLEKGIAVTGRVQDSFQRPLEAVVYRGRDGNEGVAICDSNGWFRFEALEPSVEVFTVRCEGFAPQVRQIDVGPNMPPIIFSLEPAKIISGRIIDIGGKPLKDVRIRLSSWRGFSSLNFEMFTDANGSFRWDQAPADEVLFDIYKPGYMELEDFSMTSGADYVIALQPLPAETH